MPRDRGESPDVSDISRRRLLRASLAGSTGLYATSGSVLASDGGRREGGSDPLDGAGLADPDDRCPLAPSYEPFDATSGRLADLANVVWTLFGLAEPLDLPADVDRPGLDGYTSATAAGNPAWNEWSALQASWTNADGVRDDLLEGIERETRITRVNTRAGRQPPGFVWSWGGDEVWPDGEGEEPGSYNFDQIPRYVIAVHHAYAWSRDREFFETVMPWARFVMEEYVFAEMDGEEGVPIIPSEGANGTRNDGTASGRPSTYMDQLRSGHEDGWVLAGFYTAFECMARLESHAGDEAAAARYRDLLEAFPEAYSEALWNGETGRFAGWRDVDGRIEDSGYTHVNLEAISRGIAGDEQAVEIFEWLREPARPLDIGPHEGSTDVYANVIAPRTTTESVPPEAWDGWSDPSSGRKPYGDLVQDGGTVLWLAYHDVMARLDRRHADDAHRRFTAMLDRVAGDAYCLTFAPEEAGRRYNDYGESFVQIGTDEPFPESGIAVLPFLHGFLGVEATPSALTVAPDLPTEYAAASATVDHAGDALSITARRADVVAEQAGGDGTVTVDPEASLEQRIVPSDPFDSIAVLLDAPRDASYTLGLDADRESGWDRLVARRIEGPGRGRWVTLGASERLAPAGDRYRLRIEDVSLPDELRAEEPPGLGVAWHAANDDDLAPADGSDTDGSGPLAVRTLDARLDPIIEATDGREPDELGDTLGQAFTAASAFNRVTVLVDGTDGACTATLSRRVGDAWTPVCSERFVGMDGEAELSLGDATLPAGTYRLSLADSAGSVAWYRDPEGSLAGEATADGEAVDGTRWIVVSGGSYDVSVPERDVDERVAAGEAVTVSSHDETVPAAGADEVEVLEPLYGDDGEDESDNGTDTATGDRGTDTATEDPTDDAGTDSSGRDASADPGDGVTETDDGLASGFGVVPALVGIGGAAALALRRLDPRSDRGE